MPELKFRDKRYRFAYTRKGLELAKKTLERYWAIEFEKVNTKKNKDINNG